MCKYLKELNKLPNVSFLRLAAYSHRKIFMRLLLFILFCSLGAKAQHCQPDSRFLPSVSIEGTAPIGAIIQAGLFAGQTPFSIQLGCKIMQDHTRTTDKLQNQVYKGFARLELSYRAAGDKDFGIHPFVGLSVRPDIGVMVNLSCGTYTAFRTRFAYDGRLTVGAGAVFLINTNGNN